MTSYRARLLSGVRRFQDGDEASLLQFRASVFGEEAAQADPSWLHWQLHQNPHRGAEAPLWTYQRGDELVAQQGGLPVALKVGPHEVVASWAIDLVVRPEDQVRGIGALLSEQHAESSPLAMGLGVSDAARRALLRAGWADLGTVPEYIRPLSLRRTVRALGTCHALSQVASAFDLPLGIADGVSSLRNRVAFSPVERFDERADEIFEEASPAYPVIARRDRAWLDWRYLEFPAPRRYHPFWITLDERPIGWLVLRFGTWRQLRTAFLVDFLIPIRSLRPALIRCLKALRAQGIEVVDCLHSHPAVGRALRWLGFHRRDSGLRLMFRHRKLPRGAAQILVDRAGWYLSLGDSDTDRPRNRASFSPRPPSLRSIA
jgi:hypothetical protein